MSAWKGTKDKGYVAQGTDFGSFVRLLDKLGGTAVITVDYGANLQGTGPGEPAEAAAWVAYANGKPEDTRAIGKDSVGNDWKTVGYWAAMRASAPLDKDDGYNFLRISHPAQVNIKYWEIGNENGNMVLPYFFATNLLGNTKYTLLYKSRSDLHIHA